MKKYEYKYVKTESKMMAMQKAYDDDGALLTGLGLDGWRVKEMLHAGSILGAYYLMEREITSDDLS